MIGADNPIISKLQSIWTREGKLKSIVELKREGRPPIENLVFEGGGVKGLVYAGALQEMQAQGLLEDVKRVAGSSAGGIVAMLLALGYSADEIQQIMSEEIDFSAMMDRRVGFDPTRLISAQGMRMGLSDIFMLFKHKGLYKGDAFIELGKNLITRKLEQSLREALALEHAELLQTIPLTVRNGSIEGLLKQCLDSLYISNLGDITFSQFNKLAEKYPQIGLKELYVTGTKLSDGSFREFSADKTPNMKIIDAVRITMSFPFGFEPVLYQGEYYADGGIADNYPMQIFDQEKFLTHGLNQSKANPCTLGFLVDTQEEIDARWGILPDAEATLSLAKFLKGVIEGMHNRSELLRDRYQVNSVQIFDEEVETMDLALTPEKKQRLVASGRHAVRNYANIYMGKDIPYTDLPDYQTVYEKYYSKRPTELVRIIEEELWPFYQELHSIAAALKLIDAADEDRTEQDNEVLSFIKNDDFLKRINESIEVLNEHLDVAMEALEAHKSQYIDPRIGAKQENIVHLSRLNSDSDDAFDEFDIFDINEIDYLYTQSLREVTQRLATGKWGDQISMLKQDDIRYNRQHMVSINGETYGKHASNCFVVTLEKKIKEKRKYLSFQRTYHFPPIKASILNPEKTNIRDPSKKTKEIVVAFEQPFLKAKDNRFGLVSKYSRAREKYFSEFKDELIDRLKWAIKQAIESGLQPPDATIQITISGEGLAGQDAQYFLSALIEDMKINNDIEEYHMLNNIKLLLTDPSRVSNDLARKTAKSLHDLKNIKPELNVSGYNLIHMRGPTWRSIHRKTQNFIGRANILSRVDPNDATVVADFRNLRQSQYQYRLVSNQESPQRLRQALNKSSRFYSSAFVREVNIKGKIISNFSKAIAFNYFPKFTTFMIKLPFSIGLFGLKRLCSPFFVLGQQLRRQRRRPTVRTITPMIENLPEILEVDWRTVANRLVNEAGPTERLKREEKPPIENLVFEGGGIKGLVYAGALEEMEKSGLLNDIKRVGGSSAGGITAALLGIGYTPS